MHNLEELKVAVEKYSAALKVHQASPKDTEALVAWDAATNELSGLINNEEINIIVSLVSQLETQKKHTEAVLRVADSNGNCMVSWMLQCKEAERQLEAEKKKKTPTHNPLFDLSRRRGRYSYN